MATAEPQVDQIICVVLTSFEICEGDGYIMAKYIVEDYKINAYEKNYRIPLVNIIAAIVWSIPLHQKLFPDASWWMTFGFMEQVVFANATAPWLEGKKKQGMRV